MYDVIVIGAGPAGCTAAKTLAESGYRTLLVEKFKLPRYKSCSGQLIKKTLELVRTHFGEDVPDSVTCAPSESRGMILTDDKGNEYRFEQQGLNIQRSSFDEWLARKAEQSGAELRDGTSVISVEEKNGAVEVKFKEHAEQAKFVIDCEGAVCALKRKLLKIRPSVVTTYQTFNEGTADLDYHYFYAYLQPELSEYDAWFNVKDNRLVLGVSVIDGEKTTLYYERFVKYMTENHGLKIVRELKTDRWIMPKILSGCPIECAVGRVLFAGECAGFLNPMGEGISAAIESGFSAARAVAEHFDDPAAAARFYEESVKSVHAYMQRQWNFTARLADTFKEMKR